MTSILLKKFEEKLMILSINGIDRRLTESGNKQITEAIDEEH